MKTLYKIFFGGLMFFSQGVAAAPLVREEKSTSPLSLGGALTPKVREEKDVPFFLKDNDWSCVNFGAINPLLEVTTCQRIDKSFIEQLIVSDTSQTDNDNFTTAVMDVRAIDPVISQYVDIALSYYPSLKIELLSHEDFQQGLQTYKDQHDKGNFDGYFHRILDTLRLIKPEQNSTEPYSHGMILHELRHLSMHTLAIKPPMSDEFSDAAADYFDLLPSIEKNEVMAYIKKGGTKIQHLKKLLTLEKQQKLSEKAKEHLATLRAICTHSASAVYNYREETRNINIDTYTNDDVSIKKILDNIVGQEIDIDGFPYPGKMTVARYYKNDKNQYKLVCRSDPLKILIYRIEGFTRHVEKDYSPTEYLREMDAYLFQTLSPPLLKILYTDYYRYNKKLMKRFEPPARVRPPHFSSSHFFYAHDLEPATFLTNPDNFTKSNAQNMLNIIGRYLSKKIKLEECEKGINILIEKGFMIGDPNIMLAEISYLRQNYSQAIKYYDNVRKSKTIIPLNHIFYYARSFFENREYQNAVTVCKRALQSPQETLKYIKNEFEQLLSEANKLATAQSPSIKK